MKKEKPPLCVQCQKPIKESYKNENWSAPFCQEPDCPNYGLLQTGIIVSKEKYSIAKNE